MRSVCFSCGLPADLAGNKLAIYATEKEGVLLIHTDVECIKDENNPFYNAEEAAVKGIGFFIVRHCSPILLKEMVETTHFSPTFFHSNKMTLTSKSAGNV